MNNIGLAYANVRFRKLQQSAISMFQFQSETAPMNIWSLFWSSIVSYRNYSNLTLLLINVGGQKWPKACN